MKIGSSGLVKSVSPSSEPVLNFTDQGQRRLATTSRAATHSSKRTEDVSGNGVLRHLTVSVNLPTQEQRTHTPPGRSKHSLVSFGCQMRRNIGQLFHRPDLPTIPVGATCARNTMVLKPAPDDIGQASTSGPPGRPHTSHLQRTNAGSYQYSSERVAQQSLAIQATAGVQLDAKGVPTFDGFKPAALTDVLKIALGQPGQTYQASHSAVLSEDHLLLDQQGYVLHLKQTATAVVVLRSSQLESKPGGAPATQRMALEGNVVHVEAGLHEDSPLEIIGRAHMGHLTGIHQGRDGEQLRLHEQQIYEFDPHNVSIKTPWSTKHLKFSQLSIQGNGKLYGQTGDKVMDLSAQDAPYATVPDLKAFSVNAHSFASILSGATSQTLQLFDFNQEPAGSGSPKTLVLNDGQAEAKNIGLSHDWLFVSDTEGRLYSARREDLHSDRTELRLMPEVRTFPDGKPLGAARQVCGFLCGDNGDVHALIRDRSGQIHVHPLDEQTPRLKGGWNLSDVLVLDNRSGLPCGAEPTPANTFNLDRLGRVSVKQQRVQRWDSNSQGWKDTGIKNVAQMQRGLDSKAYLLQDGIMKKLNVSPKYNLISVGTSHVLNQLPRSTEVKLGEDVGGLDGRVIQAFCMVNEKQFVALDDRDRLTAHHEKGEPTDLSRVGLEGPVTHLALDENHNLHAMTIEGELFVMAKNHWQASKDSPRPDAAWKKVPTPDNCPLASIRTADDNRLSVILRGSDDQSQLRRRGETWQPLTAKSADHNALDDLFGRLRSGERAVHMPGISLAARVNADLMGRGFVENGSRASIGEFIRAYIFKPTLETPRVLKNIGNYIQHRYHGREGLKPLYNSEAKLFKRLAVISSNEQSAALGQDLKSRIDNLNLGQQGAALHAELEAFRTELEDNSHRATRQLGQQHGKFKMLQQKEGLLNIHGELSQPSRRTQLSMKLSHLSDKFNINSSGHDLLNELQDALKRLAPSPENRTMDLLKKMQGNGMKMSHQKADVPFGRLRDASDHQGLTKSRLVLDVVTLKDLGVLVGNAEMINPTSQSDRLELLRKNLSQLRDKDYGEHPVKQITDMGFTDHASLEACYDGIKAFLNGFKKEDHAISVNLRAATGSKSQAELADTLKATLKQLENEEIMMQRNYGLNLNMPLVTLANKALQLWPNGSVTGGRNYRLINERSDKGVMVCLQREGLGSVSGGVGGGKNYWPGFFKGDEVARHTRIDIGNNRLLTPALRMGIDVNGTATIIQRDGVVFSVLDEDIDHFVDNLFSGKLKPLEVMKKGVGHETQKGLRLNVDLNASATAEFRVGLGLTDKDSSPLSAAARFGAGGTINLNLLNYANYSVDQHSNKGEICESSSNRPRLLNSLGASTFAKAQIRGGHTMPSNSTDKTSLSVVAQLGGSVGVTLDNKTVKRIKFIFKQAEPLTESGLTKLGTCLGAAFKDPQSQQKITQLADRAHPAYAGATFKEVLSKRLAELHNHFGDKTVETDEQYTALRALKRSLVQQDACEAKHSLLDAGRFESSYTNLSRLNAQSAVSKVMSLVSNMHSPSNAERVSSLLIDDPALKSLVTQMQASDGTLARVRLELKDKVQDRIDQGSRDGDLSQKELATLLSDSNNMRIKTITVWQSVNKAESFTLPLPVINCSNSVSLTVNKILGRINFSYGQDQDSPNSYVLDGELSRAGAALKTAVNALKKEGLELKG